MEEVTLSPLVTIFYLGGGGILFFSSSLQAKKTGVLQPAAG